MAIRANIYRPSKPTYYYYYYYYYLLLTFFNLLRPATATIATASRLRSQKLHIVLWGLHVGLVL